MTGVQTCALPIWTFTISQNTTASALILRTATSSYLRFDTNGANERMRIDSLGRVGIGTTSPSYTLHVTGSNLYLTNAGNTELMTTNTNGSVTGGIQALSNQSIRIGSTTNWPTEFVVNNTPHASLDSSGVFRFNSGYGSVAAAYGCRAWVNFNGTGTVAIRASGNVSSITDNGTGNYTVNFTTAMSDSNYAVVATGDYTLGGDDINFINTNSDGTSGSKTTSGFGITSFIPSYSLSDVQGVFIAVFR